MYNYTTFKQSQGVYLLKLPNQELHDFKHNFDAAAVPVKLGDHFLIAHVEYEWNTTCTFMLIIQFPKEESNQHLY